MATVAPNWNKLPVEPMVAWYDDSIVRTVGSVGFGAVGLGGAVLAFRSSASACKAFLLVLSMACFYVSKRALEPPLNDPVIWRERRVQAGREIEESGTYKEFKTKYQGLISKLILVENDIHYVIERDVQVLNYAEFMAKHADEGCKQALVDALQPSSKELLSAKCLVMFSSGGSPDAIDRAIMPKPKVSMNELALLAKSWDDFIHGGGDVREVTAPAALEALKNLFLAKAYFREVVLRDASGFPEKSQNEINKTMIQFELELIADREILPADGKWWFFHLESFAEHILQFKPEKLDKLKEVLREHYVKTVSSKVLQGEEYKARREACGLTLEYIQKAQVSVQSECEKLPYFGLEGFRKKYGKKHLTDGSLTKGNLDKIRAEIRMVISNIRVIPIKYFDDFKMLGLDREILNAHFQKKTLKEIWVKEKDLFLTYCRSNKEVIALFKPKIIADIKDLSIFELLVDFKDLFPTVLQASEESANGKTFAELAEESVKAAGKLNAQVYVDRKHGNTQYYHLFDFLNTLFLLNLIDLKSPAVRSVIRASLEEYGTKLFLEKAYLSYGTQDIWGEFFKMSVNVEASHFLKTARQEVQQAYSKLTCEHQAIDKESGEKPEYKALRDQWQNCLKEIEVRNRMFAKLQRERIDDNLLVENNGREISFQRTTIAKLQSALRGLAMVQQGIVQQMEAVRGWTIPEGDLVEVTRQLLQLKERGDVTKLSQRESEYEKLMERFAIFSDRTQIITILQKRLDAIPEEIENCKAQIIHAQDKMQELLRKKEEVCAALKEKDQVVKEYQQENERIEQTRNSLYQNLNQIKKADLEEKKARKAQLDAAFQAFAQERLDQLKKLLFP